MKLLKIITILLISELIFQSSISAQNKCPEKPTYKTFTIGNGTESMPFILLFYFDNDALQIIPEDSDTSNMIFKILEKSCAWIDSSQGQSTYKLLLVNSDAGKATLTITAKDNKGKIVLQYDTIKEPRVFDFDNNKDD